MENKIKETTLILFQRYLDIINEFSDMDDHNIKFLCEAALSTEMPIDKLSRWLGFVQGILVSYNLISVEEERDFSRPLFHAAYEAHGIEKPKTLNPEYISKPIEKLEEIINDL